MRVWAQAHQMGSALAALVALAVLSLILGDYGLPILASGSSGSPVPALALVPAVSCCIIVLALRPPWPHLDATFSRDTTLQRALWLVAASVLVWCSLLFSTSSESPFGAIDVARNVVIFLGATAVGFTIWGYSGCWVLPTLLTVASFAPAAGEEHRLWAVVVWSGTEAGALAFLVPACALCCLPVVRSNRPRPFRALATSLSPSLVNGIRRRGHVQETKSTPPAGQELQTGRTESCRASSRG